nr:SPOR domain-containing protein [uncultured Sphingomonas sp.]
MTDSRAFDDQGLPWLEGVDDEDGPTGPSARKMLVAFALVLIGAAAVAAAFFWAGRRDAQVSGAPELIRAPDGPYKVKPDDPGGLDVTGDSQTAFSTSAGEDPDSALDVGKLPGGAAPPPADPAAKPDAKPAPKQAPATEAKEATPPEAAAATTGPAIQLGAYGSTVKANTAWSMLSGRFPEVAAMKKTVIVANVGGKPIYRLRVSGSSDQARAACAALKAAGESCLPVN